MKLKIEKNILESRLQQVSQCVKERDVASVCRGLLFETSASDHTVAITGNGLDAIAKVIDVVDSVDEDASFIIPAKMVNSIVQKFPDGDVTIRMDDPKEVSISCQKSKFKLNTLGDVKDFPDLPVINDVTWTTLDFKNLTNVLGKSLFAAAKDDCANVLAGIDLKANDGIVTACATDGYRMALNRTKCQQEVALDVVLPEKSIQAFSRIFKREEEMSVGITKSFAIFKTAGVVFMSRIFEKDYPNLEKIFSNQYKTSVEVNKKELLDSLERLSVFNIGHADVQAVKFSFTENALTLSIQTQSGNASEEISTSMSGENLEIYFNPFYFMDALKHIDDENILLNMSGSMVPCCIHSKTDEYDFAILPIRSR